MDKIPLVWASFYTSCLHKHLSTENCQDGRQDNQHFVLEKVEIYQFLLLFHLHFFFCKNQIILAEPQCSYCSPKFWAHLLLFCSCDNYNFWPCITHMYIYHPHGEFLADFGRFEGNILYFNTQIRVYHILLTDGTQTMLQLEFWWHKSYFNSS